jgi:hypothetical protein
MEVEASASTLTSSHPTVARIPAQSPRTARRGGVWKVEYGIVPASLSDTDSDSRRLQIDLLRQATPARRLGLALALSADVVSLALAGIRRRNPGVSDTDAGLRFVEIHYGSELAGLVRARLNGSDPP